MLTKEQIDNLSYGTMLQAADVIEMPNALNEFTEIPAGSLFIFESWISMADGSMWVMPMDAYPHLHATRLELFIVDVDIYEPQEHVPS